MNTRKRVFIIDEHISSKQNGVGTYIQCMLDCMKALDVDTNLLSFNSDEKYFSIYEKNGCMHYCFPFCNNGKMLESGELCFPILRLYVDDTRNNVFFVNHSPCVILLKSLRKYYKKSRIIFTIHDQGWTASLLGNQNKLSEILGRRYSHRDKYSTEIFIKKYFNQERKMYNIANDVVCLSKTTKKLLTSLYKVQPNKIHLIPNGIPIPNNLYYVNKRQQFRKELGIQENERVILFVGRTVRSKGIDDLLIAFENIWKLDNKLRLVVVGEVFRLNEFVKLTPKSSIHINYIGLIPKELLLKWYSVADIGVLPSYTEQCSYTGLEMMANNLLVVTTNGNGLTDMFCHEYNALIASIEPKLSVTLEQTLWSALKIDDEKKISICRNAKVCLQRYFSISLMRERYRGLLNSEPI